MEVEMKKWFALMLATALMSFTQAGAEEKLEAIALTIADYLTAGRTVIAVNQPLINDPSKGDKGFTPQVYDEQVSLEFMKRSGIGIKSLIPSDDFNKALIAIHESAKEVIAEAQPQINEPGKEFKGFIPAVFGKRVGDKLYKKSGITIKQTSLKFRGEYNKPDEFETIVLKKFEMTNKGSTYYEETKFGDTRVLRYVVPLYIEKSCLPCHGEPAGEKDISGRIKEGYKEGDLRGAISVIVPIKCMVRQY
jgi:general secretion pathway protein A